MRDEGFDDEEPTQVTGLGSFPDVEEDDTTTRTVGRCTRCFRLVKTGGDAARPTFEEMEENAPSECWRSMSGAWWWCSGLRPFVLTLTG